VAIRKGEVWLLQNPDADPGNPQAVGYKRIASGLHEPIGLLWHEGALLTTQRTELTRLRDHDGDDITDEYECVAKGWGVTGSYHQYAYGPAVDRDGNLWFNLNSGGRKPGCAKDMCTNWRWRACVRDPVARWRTRRPIIR